ncbi:fra a 1-associated protein [Typha angustifolia]|uniref:fra a 1-associated protein n=1 Tax=Typha angustifolia TaxID=59011 RepID=UPI003C307E6D
MGWKWVEDEPSGAVTCGRGFGEIGDIVSPNPRSEQERCSTRRLMRSTCRTEEVEPGRFIKKCEKTEEILRDCIGRPAEVVESRTEQTEEDVTDEVKQGSLSFGNRTAEPFSFPGLRSDIEALERGFFGGLGDFLEEAERATNEFFQSFIPSFHRRESVPFGRQNPPDRQLKGPSKSQTDPTYSEISGEVIDV